MFNIILHRPSVDVYTLKVVASSANIIKELGGRSRKDYGHSAIINQLNSMSKSDYILPKLDFNSHFRVMRSILFGTHHSPNLACLSTKSIQFHWKHQMIWAQRWNGIARLHLQLQLFKKLREMFSKIGILL